MNNLEWLISIGYNTSYISCRKLKDSEETIGYLEFKGKEIPGTRFHTTYKTVLDDYDSALWKWLREEHKE